MLIHKGIIKLIAKEERGNQSTVVSQMVSEYLTTEDASGSVEEFLSQLEIAYANLNSGKTMSFIQSFGVHYHDWRVAHLIAHKILIFWFSKMNAEEKEELFTDIWLTLYEQHEFFKNFFCSVGYTEKNYMSYLKNDVKAYK